MLISDKGLTIIKYFEGFRAEPYLCPAGVATIGYGSTRLANNEPVTLSHPPISREQGEELLLLELKHIYGYLAKYVKVVLNQNQFDALCSFVYNLGVGNFISSTLRQKLNRGNYIGAANEFWKWRRANGKILQGLVRRRKMEEELFLMLT